MTDDDAPAFELRLRAMMEVYGRPQLSQSALCDWWRALARFDRAAVDAALDAHLAACKFAPTPADIVERLSANDGRLGPEAAWSLAILAHDDQAFHIQNPPVEAVSAVGSGDCFLAGLAYGLANGLPLAECGRIGVAAGTANTLLLGAGHFTRAGFDDIYAATRARLID